MEIRSSRLGNWVRPSGGQNLIYQAYEAVRRSTRPLYHVLNASQKLARDERNPLRNTIGMRALATTWELSARALKDYGKPRYEVWEREDDAEFELQEKVIQSLPFADLLNFPVEDGREKPKVLIAAALSGHHATLLQDTIRGFARDFDTYITDWKDAREVPLSEGDFGLDDYVTYLIQFMETLGPDTHLIATCQAAPPAMVAAAVMAQRKSKCVPASMTLMGGPVDTRQNPTVLTKITDNVPLSLFAKSNVHTIPAGYPGSGRRVYPGFYQLSGFITLNPMPHIKQYTNFVKNGIKGDDAALDRFRDFYDEYNAVLDMTESFYLETLKKVFFEHHIPTGQMTYQGELVDFGAIRKTALLTVEGENDNFCPPSQTEAAHDVCKNVPENLRGHYVQPGVGHYGVFSGSKFQAEIYPVIRDFIEHAIAKPKKGKTCEPPAKSLRPGKGHHSDEGTQFVDVPLV
jgi:poly(3-hydroxybutyrate) depolymerase